MDTLTTVIVSILATGAVGVIGWSLFSVVQHGNKIATLEVSLQSIQHDTHDIKKSMTALNIRLDVFMKTESDAFKDALETLASK